MSQEEFEQACKNGNFDLVKKIALTNIYYWNWGLYCAAKGGHINIIKFLIEKASENNSYIDWNAGLYGAAEGGHLHLIHFFIDKGARLKYGLYGAARGGHMHLIHFLLKKHRKTMVFL